MVVVAVHSWLYLQYLINDQMGLHWQYLTAPPEFTYYWINSVQIICVHCLCLSCQLTVSLKCTAPCSKSSFSLWCSKNTGCQTASSQSTFCNLRRRQGPLQMLFGVRASWMFIDSKPRPQKDLKRTRSWPPRTQSIRHLKHTVIGPLRWIRNKINYLQRSFRFPVFSCATLKGQE